MVKGFMWLCIPLALGCGDDGDGPSANPDASTPAVDALEEAEFGAISGMCGVLDDELTSASPAYVELAIEFPREFSEMDRSMVSSGALTILDTDNAGGSSVMSEAFAFEILSRCDMAQLLKTEKQINYDVEGKLTDILVSLDEVKIGVSVTRAVAFPFGRDLSEMEAQDLLEGKLADILISSANVSAEDAWQKQILAVLAYNEQHAAALQVAYAAVAADVAADTVVLSVVTNGADDFIYCDGACQP